MTLRELLISAGIVLGALSAPVLALESTAGALRVEPMVRELSTPWSIGFLPAGAFLVTERDGRLLHIADGEAKAVGGVPQVAAQGQGGLLDVLVPRDFATSREILLSYAKPVRGGAATAIATGRLSEDGTQLSEVRDIFVMEGGTSRSGRHFGSRLVEAPDGTIYATTGDRGDRPSAQDLGRHPGKVIRINRDGTVPSDNPFVGQAGVRPEIWSYGHRNPQGAALDARGQLWIHEHGASGGDEINRISSGANYGWPVISYGRHYSGATIGEGTAKPGMEQPAHYWDPSIAPSGLTVYSGKLWPDWRGDLLVGSLKFGLISRVDGQSLNEVERIEGPETDRVRDIVEAPDGSVWFISENNGAVYRLTPG